jgi:hypothetical protein
MNSYKPKTDSEIIIELELMDNYEAAYRLKQLKKENASLKRKLTVFKKK